MAAFRTDKEFETISSAFFGGDQRTMLFLLNSAMPLALEDTVNDSKNKELSFLLEASSRNDKFQIFTEASYGKSGELV